MARIIRKFQGDALPGQDKKVETEKQRKIEKAWRNEILQKLK